MSFSAEDIIEPITDLLVAHGTRSPDRPAVYAKWCAVNLECLGCATAACRALMTERNVPGLGRVEDEHNRRMALPEHADHVDRGTQEGRLAELERFWRHRAPKLIREVAPKIPQLGAKWIAARMWFSTCVDPDEFIVRDEILRPRPIWLAVVPAELTTEHVEQMYADAREVAVRGYDAWWTAHHGKTRLSAAEGG